VALAQESTINHAIIQVHLAHRKPNLHPIEIELKESYMGAERPVETQSSMRKVIFYATVISGFVAAYLMYRRGEPLGAIARQAITNPVGSLVSEVKNAV
jgi:hypothetical protein